MKAMTARYPGTCRTCGVRFKAGARIWFGGRGVTHHTECTDGKGAPSGGKPVGHRPGGVVPGMWRQNRNRAPEPCGTVAAFARHPDPSGEEGLAEAECSEPIGPEPGTAAYTARLMASCCPVDGDPDFWDRWKDDMKEGRL